MNMWDWLSSTQPATWPAGTWQGLGVAVGLTALALVLEHYGALLAGRLLGRTHGDAGPGRGLPARWNYALGLVTVGAGLLGWAAWAGVVVDAAAAAVLLVAMCAAGVPDFCLHQAEDRGRARAEAAAQAEREAAKDAQIAEMRAELARRDGEARHRAHELARWVGVGRARCHGEGRLLLEAIAGNLNEIRPALDAAGRQMERLEAMVASLNGEGRDGA